jgi:hypothetical protein
MWPSLVALLAAGGLYAALPQSLALGPRWLLMALVLFTLAPSEILHSRGHHRFCRPIGFFVISVVTIGMIVSVVLLVRAIPAHVVDPEQLLHSATALWVSNILVFAVWYWRLDAGGPHQRSLRDEHTHNQRGLPLSADDAVALEAREVVATVCRLPLPCLSIPARPSLPLMCRCCRAGPRC